MPEVWGKLVRGKTGSLEIEEGRIILKEEKGLFSKRLVEAHRSMARIRIEHQKGDEALEIVFFSEDRDGLEALKAEIDADIARRREAAEREEATHRREWESNIHHITLVLEMMDQIFQILVSLHGEPKWDIMSMSVAEAERILREMEALGVVAPVTMDTKGLASAVARRRTDEIKEEAYAILTIAHRDSERLAQYKGSTSFNLELHEVFIKSYILLWDMYLGEILGDPVDEEELNILKTTFSELGRNTSNATTLIALQEVERLSREDGVGQYFDGLRLRIHQCLESLAE
jgi:hypothetical protein